MLIFFRFTGRWRNQGDPTCDAAIETIFAKSSASIGKDLLKALEQYVAENQSPNSASDFLEEISHLPPVDIRINEQEAELARNFFLDHAVQIMQALLHYSLAAGFAR